MKPHERRLLQFYLRFHAKRPTIGRLLWLNRRTYLLTLLVFGAIIGLFATLYGWTMASYFLVALGSVLLRDFGYFRRTVRTWPLFDRLIDWREAERLVAAGGPDGTPGS